MKYIWPQPNNKFWNVETDPKSGTILVKDPDGKILTKKENLSEIVVKLIEANFFDTVAIRLSEVGDPPKDKEKQTNEFIKKTIDPMFV